MSIAVSKSSPDGHTIGTLRNLSRKSCHYHHAKATSMAKTTYLPSCSIQEELSSCWPKQEPFPWLRNAASQQQCEDSGTPMTSLLSESSDSDSRPACSKRGPRQPFLKQTSLYCRLPRSAWLRQGAVSLGLGNNATKGIDQLRQT
jgi:hypothetical protein